MNIHKEHFPTERIYKGPWLLGAEALRELDTILDKQWILLEDRRKAIIEEDLVIESKKYKKSGGTEDVKKRLEFVRDNHKFSKSVRLIQIYSDDESTNGFENFDSAIRSRKMDAKVPLSFSIKLRSADVECDVVLESNKLHVKIIPEELYESQNLFIEIRDWVEHNEPAWWQRLWRTLADARIWFYSVLVTSLLISTVLAISYQGWGLMSDIQIQIQHLIDGGISDSEIPKALELLLQIQGLDKSPFVAPPWLKTIFLLASFVSIILPFRPKIVLGIGKGARKLKTWKVWQGVVGVTIPSLLLRYVIIPYGYDLIKQLINGP